MLRYLVEETIAGRARNLKSFAVAVDGLGRPDSFDAAADSSARVQMVRLRKALESHYAQKGPVDELCIYLQPGSYVARLGKLATAYPKLYRPPSYRDTKTGLGEPEAIASNTSRATGEAANQNPAQVITDYPATSPSLQRKWFWGFAAIAAVAVIAFSAIALRTLSPARTAELSPILELMPVDAGDEPAKASIAGLVSATFADDLPRFKLSRVRVLQQGEQPVKPDGKETIYRLYAKLERSGGQDSRLFLRLSDASSNTIIWSREAELPADRSAAADALVPLLAEINGPFGIVATHEFTTKEDTNSGGYPCLLKYYSFLSSRSLELERQLTECFEKPVRETRLKATLLAAKALFTVERITGNADRRAARQQAMRLARAAVAADPNDALANDVVARLSYVKKDCVSARYFTQRAIAANPNNPTTLSTLALSAKECNYPQAEELLDRAFLAQDTRQANGRLLLIMGALAQDRPEKIAELAPTDLPASGLGRSRYYLAEALIAAAQGKRDAGRQYWRQYSLETPPKNGTATDKLGYIITTAAVRQKAMNYLKSAQILSVSEV